MKFTPSGNTDRVEQVRIHLTGMIDVIFLLLIFFIVNTRFILPESHLDPNIQTENQSERSSAADFTPQVLAVEPLDGKPAYRLGSRIVRDRSALEGLLKSLPKELGIFIQVDDGVPIGFSVSAIQLCHDAGFTKITYVPKSR